MTREELIEGLKPLAPTASEVMANDGEDTQVMYLEDVADAIMKAQTNETKAGVLDIKTRLAASIFSDLSRHIVGGIDRCSLDQLQCDTINTTNRIFNGIK